MGSVPKLISFTSYSQIATQRNCSKKLEIKKTKKKFENIKKKTKFSKLTSNFFKVFKKN